MKSCRVRKCIAGFPQCLFAPGIALALFLGLGLTEAPPARADTSIYSFVPCSSSDGAYPVAGVIMDSAGDLYGTNYGALNYGNPSGYPASYCFTQENPGGSTAGTVFELVYSRDPATGQATYTEKILHSFCAVLACADGANPAAGLIMDAAGNLYGTTQNGGTYNGGTVFELVNSSGTYSLKVLYSFGGAGDGAFPAAGLITDAAGNLYGTTQSGGAYSYGTVFELLAQSISAAGAPQATSVEKVLYSFGGVLGGTAGDGNYPVAGVIMDSAGNLYGTTPNGGAYGGGTVFELIYSSGAYSEKILYSFTGPVGVYSGLLGDGANPVEPLIMDAAGSLYGTTQNGGTYGNNGGPVFELIYYKGTYHEVILHSFTGADGDGLYPSAGLTMDSGGNLYGTTRNGGLYGAPLGFGTVFELVYSSLRRLRREDPVELHELFRRRRIPGGSRGRGCGGQRFLRHIWHYGVRRHRATKPLRKSVRLRNRVQDTCANTGSAVGQFL